MPCSRRHNHYRLHFVIVTCQACGPQHPLRRSRMPCETKFPREHSRRQGIRGGRGISPYLVGRSRTNSSSAKNTTGKNMCPPPSRRSLRGTRRIHRELVTRIEEQQQQKTRSRLHGFAYIRHTRHLYIFHLQRGEPHDGAHGMLSTVHVMSATNTR